MDGHARLNYYRLPEEEVVAQLRTNSQRGLSRKEAAQRLEELGGNTLATARRQPWPLKYLHQFQDFMVLLLVACVVLSLLLGDIRTAIVVAALVFFNTTIGFFQEFKAERVMQSLEKLVVTKASVLRAGKLIELPSAELVLGDVVYIEEGAAVPADLRIISEEELSTNDFALNGESNPSRKFAHPIQGVVPLPNRHNLCFMGTTVATGHGAGVVVATGMHTELGRIASLSQSTISRPSPLQREMNHIARRVTQGTIVLCALLLPIAHTFGGLDIHAAFLFAIGIASALIPQGLPAEINTGLAQAASKLARVRALVKKLSAVESLGATRVILTDKTGTLTKNQMTVEQFLIGQELYRVTGSGYTPEGTLLSNSGKALSKKDLKELEIFFTTGAFASNAHINAPDSEHATWYCLGDPTEGALITLAAKAGFDAAILDERAPELREFAFDSARKRMTSVRRFGKQKALCAFTKGAPEAVLERCTHIWNHNHIRPMTAADRSYILAENERLAGDAMRNLALAYRVLPAKTTLSGLTIETAERGLTWLGMASMIDPLREEVPGAMLAARNAHIKICIVTGDFATTATAIAVRAHLAAHPDDIQVVSGEELEHLSDSQVLELALQGGVIFSRVAPEDKLRIVQLVKDSGHIVAVTGDGINDAPALKRADIGVAMGLTGTDVAKQSADMILLDDSFHTLVGAIQQGRTIFQNIKKSTLACFTSNAAELVVNLVSLAAVTMFHIPLALSVMLILAIDMIAELFPIAALGWDKADGSLMHEQPRNPHHHILNASSLLDLAWCGLLIGGFAYTNYLLFFARHHVEASGLTSGSPIQMKAMALTYLTIVLCQLVNILQRRSVRGLFTRYQFHNEKLWLAMALSLFCVINIIYNPWIAPYFHAGPLSLVDWLYAIAAAAFFILIRELQRYDRQHHRAKVLAMHRQQMSHKKALLRG